MLVSSQLGKEPSPICLSKNSVMDVRTRGKFNPLEKGVGNLYPLPHTQTQEALSPAVSRRLPKTLAWDPCLGLKDCGPYHTVPAWRAWDR